MISSTEKFAPFAERMQAEGLPDIVIGTFEYYYTELLKGQTGLILEADIKPVETLPDIETFPNHLRDVGQAALPQTVFLKLNGGLGTSMGLERAKSSLPVKDDLTFLDIIVQHALKAQVLLVLMNSFVTHDNSLAILAKYPELSANRKNIPLDFLQHKVPKVVQADLSPAKWPQDPALEWCPPGHGDIYTALVTSSMLDNLLNAGYEHAFISNADNLGAVIDTTILGYCIENKVPFLVEAADRTEMDRKGGHLALRSDGQLILREIAQCPSEDLPYFQDITRHKYFNTNSFWLHLPTLKKVLEAKNYILGLPLIRNAKTIDPRDPDSTPVYQLETAMGAAVSIFQGARAVRVPRTRFIPIKNTSDLLALRSDAYNLTEDFVITPNPARKLKDLVVDLDSNYYKLIDDMEARFPKGVPSLIDCEQLLVKGDIKFGSGIVVRGKATVVNKSEQQVTVEDGAVIEGEWRS